MLGNTDNPIALVLAYFKKYKDYIFRATSMEAPPLDPDTFKDVCLEANYSAMGMDGVSASDFNFFQPSCSHGYVTC